MSSYSAALERAVAKDAHHIEIVYASHSPWPLSPVSNNVNDGNAAIPVSVLDSSFNPPTNAHLALARLSHPSSQTTSQEFKAKLLLYSVKNADKTSKAGDATPSQRLEMMVLLAKELQRLGEADNDVGSRNIAVGVCQEPTFVGKAIALKTYFQEHMTILESKKVQLTFLLGYDTLERLFAPRYYGTEENMKEALNEFFHAASGEGSKVLCARRNAGASYSQVENDILEKAAEYIDSGAISVTDIGETDRALSSSEVRGEINAGSPNWETKVPAAVAAYIKEQSLYHAE